MESCDECLRLEQQLRSASERYAELIAQRYKIRDGEREATLDNEIKRARRRRNAAGRLLLYHRINHPAPRAASMRVISITVWGAGRLKWMRQSALSSLPELRATETEEAVRTRWLSTR